MLFSIWDYNETFKNAWWNEETSPWCVLVPQTQTTLTTGVVSLARPLIGYSCSHVNKRPYLV